MPPFEWKEQTIVSFGEVAKAVMEIVEFHMLYGHMELQAMEFLDDYGEYLERMNPRDDGREMAKQTIGYLAGYQDRETKHAIFDLFECEHPYFGREDPTPEEAFQKGQDLAKEWKRE